MAEEIYRYVFDAPSPVGVLCSEPTTALDVNYVLSLEIGRYLMRVEQYVGGYMGMSGPVGGRWMAK